MAKNFDIASCEVKYAEELNIVGKGLENYGTFRIEVVHLIPEAYSPHYNFRRQRTYNVPAAKTKRFANSCFVKYAAVTNSSLR